MILAKATVIFTKNIDMVTVKIELEEVETLFRKAIMSYEFQNRITKAVQEKAGNAIEKYSNDLADKITKTLKLES